MVGFGQLVISVSPYGSGSVQQDGSLGKTRTMMDKDIQCGPVLSLTVHKSAAHH